MPHPLFSIGITTYDRFKLLKETINSVLTQTFSDFEIIIVNDNPKRKLSQKTLGIIDSRIIIINQVINIGELKNMALLVHEAKGKYFTWLADDDAIESKYLEAINQAITKYPQISSFYTNYHKGEHFNKLNPPIVKAEIYNSQQFLNKYLKKEIELIGCYGIFKRSELVKNKGMEILGKGFSPYSDVYLTIKNCLAKQLIYIDSPLVFYRIHGKSISIESQDIPAYASAQEDFVRKSIKVFNAKHLKSKFDENLYFLLMRCFQDFRSVIKRSDKKNYIDLLNYLFFIFKNLVQFTNPLYILRALRVMTISSLNLSFKNV
jgi:glycosyltransferase involved in cell wall biosynthesis